MCALNVAQTQKWPATVNTGPVPRPAAPASCGEQKQALITTCLPRLCLTHIMTCLPASVFLSLFIFICICVHLTLTVSDLYLDLFVLLSTRVSSCPSLSACSFVFCHTHCMPFSLSSPAVFAAQCVCLSLFPSFLCIPACRPVSPSHRFMCALLL